MSEGSSGAEMWRQQRKKDKGDKYTWLHLQQGQEPKFNTMDSSCCKAAVHHLDVTSTTGRNMRGSYYLVELRIISRAGCGNAEGFREMQDIC